MKPNTYSWKFMSLCAVVLAATLALPTSVDAQRAVPRGGGDSGQSSGGGGQDRGGDRTAPTPSPRGGGTRGGSSDGGSERRAAPPPRTSSPQAAPAGNADARAGDDSAQTRDSGRSETSARRRGDNRQTGVAVERRVRPGDGDGGTIIIPGGWYPWGWGGYGFAGYYGFYDPWWYGGYGYRGQYYPRRDDGSVRLKVKPRDASVYVDGYYAGTVDDFDGIFQSLPLEPGPHRIELQLDGYAPLTFDVRVLPERKITFEEEMKPLEP